MAMTITILARTVFGNKHIVYGTFDANGSANGSLALGINNIEVCFISNSENNSEDVQVVKNSNDGTEGSVAGTLYIAVADATNNTGYWMAIGA